VNISSALKLLMAIGFMCINFIAAPVHARQPFSVPLLDTEYAAFLMQGDKNFERFVKSNAGNVVALQVSFSEPPYNYKGRTDLALWGNLFFSCEGNWDTFNGQPKTGYAAKGMVSGRWKVAQNPTKLGGKPFYTLQCL
jgi:hypothetical protein